MREANLTPSNPETERERRAYSPPQLIVHGDVRQITTARDPATDSITGGSAVDL